MIDTAITTDPDFDLPHSQHGKSAAARLARYQRMMARRKRPKGQAPSKGYKTARAQAANVYGKVARKRTDDARKWAKGVVLNHDQIAVEDFRPKFLAKTHDGSEVSGCRHRTGQAGTDLDGNEA